MSAMLSGCAFFGLRGVHPTPALPETPVATTSAPPEVPVATTPAPKVPPADAIDSPAPDATAEAAPAATVSVVFSGRAPAQALIADQIAEALTGPGWTLQRLDIDDAAAIPGDEPQIVAAVGPGALELAVARYPHADIVVCQALVPNAAENVRAIAATPPASLQLSAWASLDPQLERIGLITSTDFAASLPGAEAAAAAIGARLERRYSSSDRETLYLFRRLAPDIDGLWLAPDNKVLSMAVIGEILTLAADLKIGVLVFSDALLDRGGLLSVSAPAEHVAAKAVDAIEHIRAGRGLSLPAETPLDEGAVRVNVGTASALGLPAPARAEWVVRD
jgi:hypothetical protein